jgi:uncharacterized protein
MEKHTLANEFPLYKEKIHDLKISNTHFRGIFDEYDTVENEIHQIESGATPTTDQVLNELRLKRVHLKDKIAEFLK